MVDHSVSSEVILWVFKEICHGDAVLYFLLIHSALFAIPDPFLLLIFFS